MKNSKFKARINGMAMKCALLSLVACGNTRTGNPTVTLELGKSGSQAARLNQDRRMVPFAVSMLRFCFKRVRFKVDSSDSAADASSYELEVGDVLFQNDVEALETLEIPVGTFERVEFDLDDHCATASSLQVSNDHGTFSTDDHITIKFEGLFTVEKDTKNWIFLLDALLVAMDSINDGAQIKAAAEAVSGDFEE